MNIADINKQLLEELQILEKYLSQCEQLIGTESIKDAAWMEFVNFTGEIIQILHNMRDDSLDNLYYYISETNEMELAEQMESIRQLQGKTQAYIAEYKSSLRKCNVCGERTYYFPLPPYYEEQRKKYGGREQRYRRR